MRHGLPRPLVSVAGELDIASVALLNAMLDHARRVHRPGPGAAHEDTPVDVDLTAVTFADSQGLAPVLDSCTRIVGASTAVRRVLVLLRDVPLPPPPALDERDPPPAGAAPQPGRQAPQGRRTLRHRSRP